MVTMMATDDAAMAPAAGGEPRLKRSLKATDAIESFFTGGKVAILRRPVTEPAELDNQDHAAIGSPLVLATTYGEDIVLTDMASGKRSLQIKGFMDTVTCFANKPDGTHIVIAYQSLLIKTVDLRTGEMIKKWKAHEAPVLAMDFDPTSTLVATGSADSTVKVWDVDRSYCTHNFKGHGGIVSVVRFHPDPNRLMLVSGSDDCKICVWDLRKKTCAAVFTSHVSVIRGLDFSPDGTHLYSGARDKVVNVWNIDTNELVKTMPIYESVESVAVIKCRVARDSDCDEDEPASMHVLCTGGDQGILRLWDLTTGELVYAQEREPHARADITAMVYDEASSTFVAVMSDQNLIFYRTDVLGSTPTLSLTKHMAGYNEEVLDLCFVGANDTHLAVATNTEQIRVYDVQTHDCEIVYGHRDTVVALAVSADGAVVVTGSKDHSAMVWRVGSSLSSPSSRSDTDPAQDKETGQAGILQRMATCTGHTEPVTAVAVSSRTTVPSRDRFIVTGSQDRTVKLWDMASIESGEPHARFTFQAHDKAVQSVAVAPNDKIFASAGLDKVAKIWSTSDGSLQGVMRGHRRGIWCVRFSPVDRVVATASTDKTIKIWSTTSFTCLHTLEGHLNTVLNVAFVSAGLQIVSTASDGLVKVWTIRDSECVATLDGHDDRVWALAVDRSEQRVVSGGADATVRVWTDVTVQEQETKSKLDAERLIREQDLALFVERKEYRNAVILALELDQPMRVLTILGDARRRGSLAVTNDNDSETNNKKEAKTVTGSAELDTYFKTLSTRDLERILLYVRDWNTSARHADMAQLLLNLILKSYPAQDLLELPRAREVFETILPYTERHYSHVDDAVKRSHILDYTLECME